MSTQMRGFAPAMRVMSRSEPPAFASGSWPSTRVAPIWFAITFASTCGTWLVSATRRSCASGAIATGVAPSSDDEPMHEPVRGGVGLRGRRQEPRRALEEVGVGVVGAAGLGAADRMAADEPRRAGRGGDNARLRRADVGDGRRRTRRLRARRRRSSGAARSGRRRRRARLRRPRARARARRRSHRARRRR